MYLGCEVPPGAGGFFSGVFARSCEMARARPRSFSRATSAQDVPDPGASPPGCGAARRFEFQVMPPLLYYLGVDEGTSCTVGASDLSRKAIDFGTVCVYCCPSSCPAPDGCAYVEEAAWVQPPGPSSA